MAEYIEKEAAKSIIEAWQEILDEIDYLPAANVRENVIRTNADRIRAMSEDKLIEWYCRHRDCGTCDYGHDVDCTIRAWLKSPAGEVDNGSADT